MLTLLVPEAPLISMQTKATPDSLCKLPKYGQLDSVYFTMAQQVLDGLSKVNTRVLSAESKCMICLDVYGTVIGEGGIDEPPVYFSCSHDVGAEYIRTWLSPNGEARNSCPACRITFFPAQPRPYMEYEIIKEEQEEEEDDDKDDWYRPRRRANPAAFFRDVLRLVGEAEQPPEEGQEFPQREVRESNAQRQIRAWWPEFFRTTTEQYQESIRRAREVITTPRLPPPEADMSFWSPYPYLQLCASEPINPEEVHSGHLDNVVQSLATAFRTLPFREALAYSILRDSGAEARLPVPPDYDLRPLSAEQEEAMFLEIERRGGFAESDFARQYTGLTNRERWRVCREEGGESWNPDMRHWSPDWSG